MRKPIAHNALFVLIVILTTGIAALAQSNKGTIVGTVTDPNDALVTNAQIKVSSAKTGDVREAQTGNDGTIRSQTLILEPTP